MAAERLATGPWVRAGLAATLAVEVLTAPFLFLPGSLAFLAIIVAIVSPLAIVAAVVICRWRAVRRAMTRSDVMSVFFTTGIGALFGTPLLISVGFALASLFQSSASDLPQVMGGTLVFAIIAEIVGVMFGFLPAMVFAWLAGWIVSRVALTTVEVEDS